MNKKIFIEDHLKLNGAIALADVRTPAEFAQGHIPGAYNLPLFTNEERVQVGTTYKEQGREAAVLLGFDLTGPKWSGFIKEALAIAPDKKIAVHCWRGGMRSGAMAWALGFYGFDVFVIDGGYKSYRRWAQQQFARPYRLWVLGGNTGSGKTNILHQMQTVGEQVVDLEQLAQHQGSAYGSMNRMVQPTQEQFENNFALQLSAKDMERNIWVEDESITIGRRTIPTDFWKQMCTAQLVNIHMSLEHRIEALVKEYGILDKDFLAGSTERIAKRLGTQRAQQAIAAIQDDRMADFIQLVLVYYDKAYQASIAKRPAANTFALAMQGTDAAANAQAILNFIKNMPGNGVQ